MARNKVCTQGDLLRRERLAHGMSQHDLASCVGVCRNTISSMEHGGPSVPSLVRHTESALALAPGSLVSREPSARAVPGVTEANLVDRVAEGSRSQIDLALSDLRRGDAETARRRLHELLPRLSPPQRRRELAEAWNAIGACHQELAKHAADRSVNYEGAILAFEQALAAGRGADRVRRVRTLLNLAEMWRALAEVRDARPNLHRARQAARRAQRALPPGAETTLRGRACATMAKILAFAGRAEHRPAVRRRLLQDAVAKYEAAAALRTAPAEVATDLLHRALARSWLAMLEPPPLAKRLLAEAVSEFSRVRRMRPPSRDLDGHAMATNGLCTALLRLSSVDRPLENTRRAMRTCECVLAAWPRGRHVSLRALLLHQLGAACVALAERGEGRRFARRAVSVLTEALDARNAETAPLAAASTLTSLASAHRLLASGRSGIAHLETARAMTERALELVTPESAPETFVQASMGLARTWSALADESARAVALASSEACWRQALRAAGGCLPRDCPTIVDALADLAWRAGPCGGSRSARRLASVPRQGDRLTSPTDQVSGR